MNIKLPSIEKTLVMIKPDGIARGLVGKIFQRFEEQGLKLVATRMIKATAERASKHYPVDNEKWLYNIGKKSSGNFNNDKKQVKAAYGTDDFKEIGRIVHKAMIKYLISGPMIISVWEGNHAIERVRKLVGSTVPTFAEVGSIRGIYAFDTPVLAAKTGRITFRTIIHTSDSKREVQREIEIWFGKKYKDLSNYERIDYIDIF